MSCPLYYKKTHWHILDLYCQLPLLTLIMIESLQLFLSLIQIQKIIFLHQGLFAYDYLFHACQYNSDKGADKNGYEFHFHCRCQHNLDINHQNLRFHMCHHNYGRKEIHSNRIHNNSYSIGNKNFRYDLFHYSYSI